MSIWGGGARLVVGFTMQRPYFIFPCPWVNMMAKRESTIFGERMRRRARK